MSFHTMNNNMVSPLYESWGEISGGQTSRKTFDMKCMCKAFLLCEFVYVTEDFEI